MPMNSGEVSFVDHRNVGSKVGMRPDPVQGNFEFFHGISQQISTVFQRDFQGREGENGNDLMRHIA